MKPRLILRWLACLWVLVVAACAGLKSAPAPNLYQAGDLAPYDQVPEALQSNQIQVLYVTDRLPIETNGRLDYGAGRSWAPHVGTSDVTLGRLLTWEEVVADSLRADRAKDLKPSVGNTRLLFRFPRHPMPVVKTDQGIQYDPQTLAKRDQGLALFQEAISRRLSVTPRKEAFVFIHGFNYSFERAIAVAGELWHYLGREGIPIAYTWPAGRGGISGYFYDRESSEFTVYHMRRFLQILAQNPDLEHISLIAHSRGTEVVTSALRELQLELGADKMRQLKIRNLVLAAPDLDIDVVAQRWVVERLGQIAERTTIYISTDDFVLGFAERVFGDTRVGRVARDELPQRFKDLLALLPGVQLINAEAAKSLVHGYFYEDPAVLSDLILVLRYNRKPGADFGRPLVLVEPPNLWKIPEGYPYPADDRL